MLSELFADDRFPRASPDFNFGPEEPGYALLVGDMLTPAQEELLERSRVVHVSVDPTIPLTNPAAANDDEDGGAQADPDRVITNAREASPADGLLNSSELLDLFAVTALRPRSSQLNNPLKITFGLSTLRTEELLLRACFSHTERKTSILASLARGYLVATMSRLRPKFNGIALIKIAYLVDTL